MKTNVTYESKKYYVNKSKKTVACTLNFSINLDKINCINVLCNIPKIVEYLSSCEPIVTDENDINYGKIFFNVTGIAKCSENDEFDQDLGEKIALSRAQKEAFIIASAFYKFIDNAVNEYFSEIKDLYENSKKSKNSCATHIIELWNK